MSNLSMESLINYFCDIDRPYHDLMNSMEKYANENHIPICRLETGSLLSLLVSLLHPKKILELGTAIGYSGLWIMSGHIENRYLITIEINEECSMLAESNFRKAGIAKKVRIINDDISVVLPCLNEEFDLIFMDAAKGQNSKWLEDCLRLLSEKGIIIIDNIFFEKRIFNDGVIPHKHRTIVNNTRNLINGLKNDFFLETTLIPIGDGLIVCRKRNKCE